MYYKRYLRKQRIIESKKSFWKIGSNSCFALLWRQHTPVFWVFDLYEAMYNTWTCGGQEGCKLVSFCPIKKTILGFLIIRKFLLYLQGLKVSLPLCIIRREPTCLAQSSQGVEGELAGLWGGDSHPQASCTTVVPKFFLCSEPLYPF